MIFFYNNTFKPLKLKCVFILEFIKNKKFFNEYFLKLLKSKNTMIIKKLLISISKY